jgi:hypothetical protein
MMEITELLRPAVGAIFGTLMEKYLSKRKAEEMDKSVKKEKRKLQSK